MEHGCFICSGMLSLITVTRERIAHPAKWEDCRSGDSCSGERPDERVWDFYREYAGALSEADCEQLHCVVYKSQTQRKAELFEAGLDGVE